MLQQLEYLLANIQQLERLLVNRKLLKLHTGRCTSKLYVKGSKVACGGSKVSGGGV